MYTHNQIYEYNYARFGSPAFSERNDTFYRRWIKELSEGEYVYVLQDKDVTGFYKIGFSTKPLNRVMKFDVTLPFGVWIIAVIPVLDARHFEKHFHRYFQSKRVNGEWFALDPEDIYDLKQVELRYPVLTMHIIERVRDERE